MSGSADALTGAYTRVAMQERLAAELDSARRDGLSLSLAVFDLDHFKSINDAFGHLRGDQVLAECVHRLKEQLRSTDMLFRYGGDEFVLLMTSTDRSQALAAACRLLQGVRATPFAGDPPITASITMGIATFPADGESPEKLFACADARLYAAKRSERGTVVAEDAASFGVQPFAGVPRLIEREGALESLRAFLDELPGQSGIFAVTGARGTGRSRLLAEVGNIARLRGLAVLSVQASPALRVRPFGALVEALREWKGLPPVSDPAFTDALADRLAGKGHAGLFITVDDLPDLDPDTFTLFRNLFASGALPMLALAYSAETERALRLDAPLQQTIHLAPLTPAGLRVWLRTALHDEPPAAFLNWFHARTGGLPGLVERGLSELAEQGALQQAGQRWRISPTYVDVRLTDPFDGALHNLPPALTSFIGREAELDGAKQSLEAGRLVTLLGPGGVGKTRLAQQVAAELIPHFRHGVRFVPLAPVVSAEGVAQAIVDALGLTADRHGPRAKLLQHLQNKQMLLVLDNFDHLIDGADLIPELLQAAPQVRVLVTSRERLHLPGEALLEIGGLPAYDEAAPAVQLFLERARLLQAEPGGDLSQVARICQDVAGMPLGIELAAAWVRMLSYQEIAAGIERSLDFLATSRPDLPERHRSLQAAFAYSWQRLSPEEQGTYSRLSVFRGGFGRSAAEQVAGASPFLISALLDKSLLRRAASGRYELHELLRQYAAQALADDEPRRRHAAYFLNLAEEAALELEGPGQVAACASLTIEQPNLRAAMQWSLDQEDAETALRLCAALWRFWEMRGFESEGRRWAAAALALPGAAGRTAARAYALAGAEHMARRQGDFQQSRAYLEEALAIWRELGNAQGVAEALEGMGVVAASVGGDPALVQSYSDEALATARALGNPRTLNRVLNTRGHAVVMRGQFAEAVELWDEALALARAVGNTYAIAMGLNNISIALISLGEYDRAHGHVQECLALAREVGTRPLETAALGNLGMIALARGEFAEAGTYFQECLAVARETGAKPFIAITFGDLGLLARRQGELDLAAARHAESLAIAQAIGYKLGIVYYLLGMAGVAAAAGEARVAARLLGAADGLQESMKLTPDLVYRQERDYAIATTKAKLGEAEFAPAVAQGRELPLEAALAEWRP